MIFQPDFYDNCREQPLAGVALMLLGGPLQLWRFDNSVSLCLFGFSSSCWGGLEFFHAKFISLFPLLALQQQFCFPCAVGRCLCRYSVTPENPLSLPSVEQSCWALGSVLLGKCSVYFPEELINTCRVINPAAVQCREQSWECRRCWGEQQVLPWAQLLDTLCKSLLSPPWHLR